MAVSFGTYVGVFIAAILARRVDSLSQALIMKGELTGMTFGCMSGII
jgi:hypothetical protein